MYTVSIGGFVPKSVSMSVCYASLFSAISQDACSYAYKSRLCCNLAFHHLMLMATVSILDSVNEYASAISLNSSACTLINNDLNQFETWYVSITEI